MSGCFLGVDLLTDKDREEEAKYLQPGEVIMVTNPKALGVCTPLEVILEDGKPTMKLGAKVVGHPMSVCRLQLV